MKIKVQGILLYREFFTPSCVPPCEGGKERGYLAAAVLRYELQKGNQQIKLLKILEDN